MRKRIQMVFQDPTDSLNPRFTAARAIADPILRLGNVRGRKAVRARCEELARQVGLPLELLDRFPHQLSGGQKARVGIARAIALNPDLVILDEPTAALDVSVQAVVLNLLQELKEQLGMSYLFVSHDLNVVRLLCDRVIVMRAGAIVEQGPTERVLSAPEATIRASCWRPFRIRRCDVGWVERERMTQRFAGLTLVLGLRFALTQPTKDECACRPTTPTSTPSSTRQPRRWPCRSSRNGSRR